MSEDNKATHRRFFDAWNEGTPDALDQLMSADAVDHDGYNAFAAEGREGLKKLIMMYREAFPDIHFEVEEQLAEGEMVATRWTATGTHEGELMGIAPSLKQVTVTGITIDRFDEGKITETWTNWDTLGLMQSIGAVPQPGAAHA